MKFVQITTIVSLAIASLAAFRPFLRAAGVVVVGGGSAVAVWALNTSGREDFQKKKKPGTLGSSIGPRSDQSLTSLHLHNHGTGVVWVLIRCENLSTKLSQKVPSLNIFLGTNIEPRLTFPFRPGSVSLGKQKKSVRTMANDLRIKIRHCL